jgi:hypothetical protein
MTAKAVFAEQAEEFAVVVDALLRNERTRDDFAKAPIATLKKAGITIAEAAVAKKVETDLAALAGGASAGMPGPDDYYHHLPRYFARATSIMWVAKGDLDDVIAIDRPRVDAFVKQASLEIEIAGLKQRIVQLEANQVRR